VRDEPTNIVSLQAVSGYAAGLMRARMLAVPLCMMLTAHAAAARSGELYVLAISGGGDKLDNFASHLAHLRQLTDLLATAGIPRDHITVLASDGADPAPDLATRDPEPEFSALLQGTRVESLLRDFTTYESSTLAGIALRPATVSSLKDALAELRARVRPEDTVLLFVTDHGTQGRRDPLDNRITLWGAHESISARKLGALLSRLPSSVRVVSLMSQCFSGGFAYLHETRERQARPSGATCGYFSSTPDRPAYGCYPEVRGRKAIGHAFEFLSALARRGRFAAAHADVLVSDSTPDIPLRSSDVYIAEQLAQAAGPPEREARFLDPLLKQVSSSESFRDDSVLLDRMARVAAIDRPRTVAELNQQAETLLSFLDRLDSRMRTWEGALADFNKASLEDFLAARPDWKQRLGERALRAMDAAARRSLVTELLAALGPWVMSDHERGAEANRLLDGLGATDEVSYRTEIRIAALFRMHFVFTTAAGRVWMKGKPEQETAVKALLECEDLSLPLQRPDAKDGAAPDTPKLPRLSEDEARAEAARPGWLGIAFVPVGPGRCKTLHLPAGAAQITSIVKGSPAAEAGLRTGDIVLAHSAKPFVHPTELRPFIVAATPGKPLVLDILRGKTRVELRAQVRPAPAEVRR
jgi:hypothetical protein